MKRKILILSLSELHRDPRVLRQINWLNETYEITVAGYTNPMMQEVAFIKIESYYVNKYQAVIKDLLPVINNDFEKLYWERRMVRELKTSLDQLEKFDLIIANDAEMVPIAFTFSKKWLCKLIVDLHEYAPKQYEDRLYWKFRYSNYYYNILKKFLPKADSVITVCEGIAVKLWNEFSIKATVVTNAPWVSMLAPSPVREDEVHIVHHGGASPSRKIETMIEMMNYLDKRFYLNLILVGGEVYQKKLKNLARNNRRIKFLNPVATSEIASYINKFDIGLFLAEPITFNLKVTLPNKFFEFIHARLCIAIGPSEEMARITSRHDLGVISEDFKPQTLAQKLNSLSSQDIMHFKNQCNLVASSYSADANKKLFSGLVDKALY